LMNGGIFVYVPKNVVVNDPLQTIFWQEDNELALFNHVIVVAEESSSVTYVENYVSHNKEEASVANIITEVFAQDNAKVSFGAVDDLKAGVTTYINSRGIVQNDGTLYWDLVHIYEGQMLTENVMIFL